MPRAEIASKTGRLTLGLHGPARKDGRKLLSPSFDSPRRNPKLPRDLHGINRRTSPPGLLVAKAVVVPVMRSAQRYGEFVADLASHRAGLRESKMVGVSGASPTNKTRL